MEKIKITQIKSAIGKPVDQKRTLVALGIRKMHQTVEHDASKTILGMVDKVKHLLNIEEVKQ